LIETQGDEVLSRPKASIIILEATHFAIDKILYTKGFYKVLEIFKDDNIHFECFDQVEKRK